MATYLEIYDLQNNDTVHHKVVVAMAKKAEALLELSPPTDNQVAWANSALSDPSGMAKKLIMFVLADSSAATVSQITSASDASVQTVVSAAADALIAGGIVN